MIYLVFCLFILVLILGYYCLKFAFIIIKMQETIENSLDMIDESYRKISEINDIPVFFDTPEIRRLLVEIDNIKLVILNIANKLSSSSVSSESEVSEDEL